MGQTHALTFFKYKPFAGLMKPAAVLPALTGLLTLTGCQSSARQDVFTTQSSTCAYMMPTVSGTRTYPAASASKSEADKSKLPPDSAIAYPDPETPAYCDRPIAETLLTSIELADYTRGLQNTGLLNLLQREGPYTVFAIPNSALETYSAQTGGTLMSPQSQPALRQLLSYTIVTGKWPLQKLKTAIQTTPGHTVQLPTVYGRPLLVSLEASPAPQIIISNGAGMSSRLWVTGIPQSNGVLYFTQSLIQPPAVPVTPSPVTRKKSDATTKTGQIKNKKSQNVKPATRIQSVTLPAPSAGISQNTDKPAISATHAVSATPAVSSVPAAASNVAVQNAELPAAPSLNEQNIMLPSASDTQNIKLPTSQEKMTSDNATQPLPGHRTTRKSLKTLSSPPDLKLP